MSASELQKKLSDLSTAVRQRPGMYFGTQGAAAIVQMTRFMIDTVLAAATSKYRGPIAVSVAGQRKRQTISIEFGGYRPSEILRANQRRSHG